METEIKIVVFGTLGGIIAEMIRLSKARDNLYKELTNFNTYASIFILACVGAFATVVFGAGTIKEAASIGIAAPVLLSNLVARSGPDDRPPPPTPPADPGDFEEHSGAGTGPSADTARRDSFIDTMRRRWAR